MKKLGIPLLITLILSSGVQANEKQKMHPVFDVTKGTKTFLHQVLPDIKKKKIIFVGENHDLKSHHLAQLRIIRALHESPVPVAVGLEMFGTHSQAALDRWINGQLSDEGFQKVYYENWNVPWPLYSMIFEYVREMRIPLVGLNVARAITRHVASEGFQSLSREERNKLPDVACKVDPDYMAFIRRAYGAHAHGGLNFTYFCEAQLVWDTVMAINAIEYLQAHPNYSLALLAGTGHAWKKGIPEQIRRRSRLPYTVLLPHIPGNIEPESISAEDADYILLDL